MKPVLIMMLGHPGSGKSYFSKQLAQTLHAVRFNADHMRTHMFADIKQARDRANNPMVFGAIDYAVAEVLRAGHSVIYDVQHNAKSQRQNGAAIATPFDVPAVLVWVKTPYDIALKRGQERDETPDQLKRTEAEMRRSLDFFIAALEPPTPDEPCIIIDGTIPFAQQYKSYNKQLSSIIAP